MEKIQQIYKAENEKNSGYHIKTDKQVIKLLMGDIQYNFEKFGYELSEKHLDKFIGSHFIEIKEGNKALNEESLYAREIHMRKDIDDYEFAFINVHTSVGILQFATYCLGDYGHQVLVESETFNYERWI
ncbi:hypothetical protein F6Y05_37320 [Bacillus megaterium]|nr:hypothetical protein [Priestia megaterium]